MNGKYKNKALSDANGQHLKDIARLRSENGELRDGNQKLTLRNEFLEKRWKELKESLQISIDMYGDDSEFNMEVYQIVINEIDKIEKDTEIIIDNLEKAKDKELSGGE